MDLEFDPNLKKVPEFMQTTLPTEKLVFVSERLHKLQGSFGHIAPGAVC